MFNQLRFLYFLFELLAAQLNQLNCSLYKADENFYVKQSNGIIFENDHPKIDQIGYDLFEKSFVMQNFSSGEIKSIFFMNSIKFNMQLVYCFCQLLDDLSSQSIVCIDGIEIDLQTNQYRKHKNAQTTNIQIQKENGYCDKILSDFQNYIKTYCQNSTYVILNYVNLQDQSSFQIIHNKQINDQNCSRKFFNFQKEEYLSYYNCSDWRIYLIDMNQMKFQLIINEEIFSNYFDYQIKILNDIENCQDNLYLIESNKYFQLKRNAEGFQLLNYKIIINEILKIFIADQCNLELIVTQNFDTENKIIFKKDENEISISQNIKLAEIFYNQKFLLIKRKNQLKLVFSEFLQSQFTLIDNPLICMYQNGQKSTQPIIDSFCYQIDTQFNKVIYYRFLQYKKFIKPSKKFVFQITNFQVFSTFLTIKIDCYKIVQESHYTNQVVQDLYQNKLSISNYCNSIHKFIFPKSLVDPSQNFQLDILPLQNQSKIDIDTNDDFLFKQMCQNFEFNIEKIVWVSYGKPPLFSYIIDDIFYFYDCSQNQIYYQMNVKDQMILTLKDAFIIWKINQNFIILLSFFNKINKQNVLTFEYQVKDIIFFHENFIIVKFLEDSLIYNIYSSQQIYLDKQLTSYGSPIYYFGRGVNFQMVQFNNYLAIKAQSSQLFRIIEFINKKINKINDNYKFLLIQTIHNEQNLIQTFIYDGVDLTLTEELRITDSQIYRPLIVSQSLYHTVLAITKNQENRLMLLHSNSKLKIIEIKAIKRLSFHISKEYLFYFDNKSDLRYKDLLNFQITLQTTSKQINPFNIYQVQLRLIFNYENKIEQFFKPQKLILKNECRMLMPKNNEISIQQSKINRILKVNQFFYGSINNISTDHANISIQNPFDIDRQKVIHKCQQQIDNFCIFFNYTYPEFLHIDCLIKRKDYGQITFEVCKTRNGFKQFYIKSLQTLVHFSLNFQKFLEIKTIGFTVEEQQIITKQLPIIKFSDEIHDQEQLQILNTEYLFIIMNNNLGITKNYFFHLFISNLNFEDLIFLDIRQIAQIKNLKNYYLILIFDQASSYKFIIIFLEQEKICIHQQFNFNHEEFIGQLLDKNQFEVENIIQIQYLSSDSLVDDKITAQFLVALDGFTLEVQLNFDLQTQLSNFKAQKIIRNPNQYQYKCIHYYDQKILILTYFQSLYYLYDLSQDLQIYDHFYIYDGLPKLIYEFNTTHYLLYDYNDKSYFVDEIGYKIILQGQNLDAKTQLNFTLRVENNVSSSTILIHIQDEEQIMIKDQIKMNLLMIIYVIIITAILISIVIIYKKKNVKKYNEKQNAITINKNIELF